MVGEASIEGPAGRVGDMRSVHVDVRRGDEWVYVEERQGRVEVWSGDACRRCKLSTKGLRRCEDHAATIIVALQLRLAI